MMEVERGKPQRNWIAQAKSGGSEQSYVYITVAIVFCVGMGLVALAAFKVQDCFWCEIGKAGLQLAVVAVIGGVATAALRRLDAIREERRRLGEYLLTLLRDVISAYNQIKASRRILRAFGFRSPADGPIRQDQLAEFLAQMRSLNQAQLSLERIARELDYHPVFLDASDLRGAAKTAEKYVGQVLSDWEREGQAILVSMNFSTLRDLEHLQSFLESSSHGFEDGAAAPMEALQTGIRDRIFSSIGPSAALV